MFRRFHRLERGSTRSADKYAFMKKKLSDDHFQAEFRAKLYSSQVDSGLSLPELEDKLNLEPAGLLSEYFHGSREMPVSLLYRYSYLVARPVWWFFGEQPSTISIESAQNALTNVSRVRLYLEALEAEFRSVIDKNSPEKPFEDVALTPKEGPAPVVVNFAPYLSRARAILEAEAECTEDSEEVFEESVELIAQRLYSIEMAATPSQEFVPKL